MTALIYKAALPTYTSAEALAANADENLVLNDAGTAYELEPGQSGASDASVRYLTEAEMRAATGIWTYAVADLVCASGALNYPLFDTFVGDATNFELAESTAWQQAVPYLKTPGIYQVAFTLGWPANAVGTRSMEWIAADEDYTEPFAFIADGRRVGSISGSQRVIALVHVYGTRIGIQTTVSQDSGSSLTVPKENIRVEAWKLAEFL